MIRLAIVAPHFPEYALRYASAMARHCEVMVCVDAAQLAEEYVGRGIAVPANADLMTLRFKTAGDVLRLYRALRRFKPTILHFQEAAGPRRAMFNAILARLFRRAACIIVTVHDPTAHAGRDAAAARRTASIAHDLRKLADRIVVHGRFCAGQMATLLPAHSERLLVSEHGLLLEPDRVVPPPEPPPLRVYFFGRMETYKGVEILLSAAELLHAEGFPFALSIAGRGPELDRLQARFARLPEVTIFNGFVPPMQIMADIQAAECIVLPYLTATQSGVLAAAYAGRRYVLASATGGLPDVVTHGENGLLVPPGDSAALADAIRQLGRNPDLRARLLRGAQETAEKTLDWDRIAACMAARFEELADITALGRVA
jgi:glycosyltransferase involved in cell wall biosynthesis